MAAKKIFIAAVFAIAVCQAQFQVPLTRTDVFPAAGNQYFQDSIVTFQPTVNGNNNGNAIFDTTASFTYQINTPGGAAGPAVQALGAAAGQIVQTGATQAVQNYSTSFSSEYTLNTVSYLQTQLPATSTYANQGVNYGYGLNFPSNTNAPNLIVSSQQQGGQTPITQFSFYLWNDINLAIFGQAPSFFTDGNLTNPVPTLTTATLPKTFVSSWAFTILSAGIDATPLAATNILAQIDTTTEFLTVDNTTFSTFVTQFGLQALPTGYNGYFVDSTQYSKLTQTLNFAVQTAQKTDFSIPAKNLFRSAGSNSNQYVFLVRNSKATTAQWTLGRAFLTSVLTVFNANTQQNTYSLQFATANDFRVQPITLNTTSRAWLIAVGVILFALAVFVVLRLLKPLGNVEPVIAKATRPAAAKAGAPAQLVYQAQPVFYQQPVQTVYVQPGASQIAPIVASSIPAGSQTYSTVRAVQQGSPTRVLQTTSFPNAAQSGFVRQQ